MRVVFKIGVWLFALCAGAVVSLHLIVGSEWFLQQARGEIERGLNCRVSFSSVSPSLLYGVGIRVSDCVIYERDGRTPCLQSDAVLLKVKILPLLWRSLDLSTVSLARPRLSLVRDENGAWNVAGILRKEKPSAAKPRPGAGAGKTKGKGRFSISRFAVSDGIVTISDPSWSRQMVLKELNLKAAHIAEGSLPYLDGRARIEDVPLAELTHGAKELGRVNVKSGSLSGPVAVSGWLGKKLQFQAKLAARDVQMAYGGYYKTPECGLAMNVEVRGDGSYTEKVWDIRKISAESCDGRLRANGSLFALGRSPEARLEIIARNLPWKSIGTLAVPGLSLGGSSEFSAALQGRKDDIGINLALNLRESSLSYGAHIAKQAGSAAETRVRLRIAGASIQWTDAVVQIEGLRLASEGSLQTAGARSLKARFKTDGADLKSLNGILTPGVIAAGKGDMDMVLERALDQPPNSAAVSGSARVTGCMLRFAGFGQPVMCDAVCTGAGGNVRLGLNTVRVGSSCVEGYLNSDLKRWPELDWEFNFPVVDTADFAAPSRARNAALPPRGNLLITAAEAAPLESVAEQLFLPPLMKELKGRGRISLGELRMGNLKARGGHGESILSKGVLSVDKFSLPLYGGESAWKLDAALSGREPRYSLEGTVARADLAALLSDLYGYSDALSGWLSLECAASGAGREWASIEKDIRAKGRFSVHEGRLRTVGLLREIAPLILLLGQEARCKEFLALGELVKKAPPETRFSRCEGNFTLEGERWGTGNMLLEVNEKPNPMRLLLGGEMGPGGKLSLKGRVSFPKGSAYYQQLAPYFPDDGGWIAMPFLIPVGGTLSHPQIDLEAARGGILSCAAEIGAARFRKEVEKKIDRALAPNAKTKGDVPAAEDAGREMLRGASKELLKQMIKQ